MSSISSGSASVDGLVSGLNTTDLVAQLMAIEARPQTLMKLRQSGFNNQITAFESVRSLVSAMKIDAQALIGANDWSPVTASSNHPSAVSVTGGQGTSVGSITFTVDRLASAHTLTSSGTVASLDTVVGSGSLTVAVGGDSRSIPVGDGTLQSVVEAINAERDFGVAAMAVKVGEGAYRLQLTATTPGSASTITVDPSQLTGLGGSWLTTSTGQDAQVTVGSGANAYTITSATNTLEGVLPGVTITLQEAGSTVTVTSSRDGASLADRAQKLVDSVNKILAEVAKQTKYDATEKKGSPLTGDSTVRDLQRSLMDAISSPMGDAYPDTYGFTVQRDGTIGFDRSKFLAAYAADPEGTQAAFDGADPAGIATRLVAAADRAIDPVDGMIITALKGRRATVQDLQTQIDAYQIRLDRRQATLKAQFASLETALANLNSQGQWLAGQLSGLSSGS